ncbi:hypothetical protein K438DRAFT_1772182 [Mycena galopus ATCC 62051]|nr:hypothetical protein K438DRAFT_1772182 [Mycena galopus ATCC 62051]
MNLVREMAEHWNTIGGQNRHHVLKISRLNMLAGDGLSMVRNGEASPRALDQNSVTTPHLLLVARYFGMSSVSTVIKTRNTHTSNLPPKAKPTLLHKFLDLSPAAIVSRGSNTVHNLAFPPSCRPSCSAQSPLSTRSASAHERDPHTLQPRHSSCYTYLTAPTTGTKAAMRASISTGGSRFNSAVPYTGTTAAGWRTRAPQYCWLRPGESALNKNK